MASGDKSHGMVGPHGIWSWKECLLSFWICSVDAESSQSERISTMMV